MITQKNAELRLREAQNNYDDARRTADAAADIAEEARAAVDAAAAELDKARWGSVPCPVCGAKVGANCPLERTGQEENPGILHTARVAIARAGR